MAEEEELGALVVEKGFERGVVGGVGEEGEEAVVGVG